MDKGHIAVLGSGEVAEGKSGPAGLPSMSSKYLDDEDEGIPTYEELERVLEPELVRIMREVREGLDEAALPRVADDDVAYDMDNIGGDMDSESSDSDDTDSVDEVPDGILFMEATGEEGSS
ncbi:hypothetical protein CC1G_01128 [Coprinopsis cinerea okayama7|uniref:Uncharacterized protein n=1 Tax=Coprinopsis cinerea (strain Okayama-7 / 130 / ATCC MYA-4618 / FGSC 9003) TaxID=240176 RepID=A8NEL6_COPC7|nr:hypothetical protein CC1G_01128 [Coprinopsis cinerea okayama7\|eukprot:XP_001833066.2 hypothetical protein CC1G_01128 [Coprinopsis cinerea okayama7\